MRRDPREVVRDEPFVRRRLTEALQGGPLTVPELASATGWPTEEVMVWVMSMRKYGYLAEEPGNDAEGYYRYRVVKK
jgi:predicted Rossmann fold nucleotide-binding protein DprA/Smf involved in DNA uptake